MIDTDTLDERPIHPAATRAEDALLRWARDHAAERAVPPMSRGRYQIADPDTGKDRTWMRMSRLADVLFDGTGIVKWEKGNIVRGLLADRELLDLDNPDDIARIAGRRGGDFLKANLGTAMHTAVERYAAGLSTDDIPAPYDADLAAIIAALEAHGITFTPGWAEAALLYPEVEAAGRTDGVVAGPWGDWLRIADIKTGRLDFGVGPWAAQLAGYARAPYRWTTDGLVDAPARDPHTGIIIHAPIGTGTCDIYTLDLDRGHEILLHSYAAVKHRGKHMDWLIRMSADDEPVHVSEPIAQVVEDLGARTDAWLRGRITALRDQPDAVKAVRLAWPANTPGAPPWTPEQRSAVEAAVSQGEQMVGAPFPAPRPTDETPAPLFAASKTDEGPTLRPRPDADGVTVDAAVCADVARSVRELDADRRAQFRAWLIEAKKAGRAIMHMVDGEAWPATTHALIVAMGACLVHLWDDGDPTALTRAALAIALGDDAVQPTFSTGALLATLTPDEARRITQIAVAFGRSEPDTCAALGLAVAS